jgi:hypothetical protein
LISCAISPRPLLKDQNLKWLPSTKSSNILNILGSLFPLSTRTSQSHLVSHVVSVVWQSSITRASMNGATAGNGGPGPGIGQQVMTTRSWIKQFCNAQPILVEIDRSFIEDSFNLYGLKQIVSDFGLAMSIILDKKREIILSCFSPLSDEHSNRVLLKRVSSICDVALWIDPCSLYLYNPWTGTDGTLSLTVDDCLTLFSSLSVSLCLLRSLSLFLSIFF